MNRSRLETLCGLCGTSGREHAVRTFIMDELRRMGIPAEDIRTDGLGNVLVHKRGKSPAKKRVMFSAHMDEVALMATSIHSDGTLAFDMVGGVNASAVIGRQVLVGRQQLPGVIGCKPIHLMSKAETNKAPSMHGLFCDIGTASAEETKKLVRPGDIIYFLPGAKNFGTDSFCSKAIDDRFGCEILLALAESELPYDVDLAFVVQEEVGLRGSGVAAMQIKPEIAVIFEATTAADIPGSEGADRVCELGGGAVISFIDGRTVYDAELYDMAGKLCEKAGIRWQTKTKIAGGNDAGAIQQTGARVLAVSVPCRYLHAPNTVIRWSDAEECEKLALALCDM